MDWKRQGITFVVLFLLVGVLFAAVGTCRAPRPQAGGMPPTARVVDLMLENPPAAPGRLSPDAFTIRAEVADTKEKRQQGLSGRSGLQPGYGMLYVYEQPEQPEFSEASTRFAVSVAFLSADGAVLGIHDTEPNDPTPFTPSEPVKYALEVRRGWFQDHGLSVGARFVLPPDIEAAAGALPPPAGSTSPAPAQAPPEAGTKSSAPAPGEEAAEAAPKRSE